MINLNKKQIDFIRKEFIRKTLEEGMILLGVNYNTPKISTELLEKHKISTDQKSFDVGNLRLEQDSLFSTDYSIYLIDKSCNLQGVPLNSDKQLLDKIQKIWSNGENTISFQEMIKLDIYTPLSKIKIDNFRLDSSMSAGPKYSIELIDSKKDGYGRWIDSSINTKRVKEALNEYKLTKKSYIESRETTLNTALEKHLRKYFANCSKSRGGQKGMFDLEIGSMNYLIEIKMARSAKSASERDRCDGQMKRYLSEFKKKESYMLLIAGEKGDLQHHHINGLRNAAEKDYGVNFYFMEAV